jgi:hypothetical protein
VFITHGCCVVERKEKVSCRTKARIHQPRKRKSRKKVQSKTNTTEKKTKETNTEGEKGEE